MQDGRKRLQSEHDRALPGLRAGEQTAFAAKHNASVIAGERTEGFRPRIDAQNRTLEADRVIRAAGVLYV